MFFEYTIGYLGQSAAPRCATRRQNPACGAACRWREASPLWRADHSGRVPAESRRGWPRRSPRSGVNDESGWQARARWSPARRGDDVEAGHKVAVMAKPVLVVVGDDDTSLRALTRELESRYGAHYRVVSSSSPEMALAQLAELQAAGADVPLVVADQRMSGMDGTQLLSRVRQFFPTARRGLLITWGDMTTPAP